MKKNELREKFTLKWSTKRRKVAIFFLSNFLWVVVIVAFFWTSTTHKYNSTIGAICSVRDSAFCVMCLHATYGAFRDRFDVSIRIVSSRAQSEFHQADIQFLTVIRMQFFKQRFVQIFILFCFWERGTNPYSFMSCIRLSWAIFHLVHLKNVLETNRNWNYYANMWNWNFNFNFMWTIYFNSHSVFSCD